MSLETLPDWLHPLWDKLRARGAQLPHALLLCGPAGSGKRLFAEHLARSLLCQSPDAQGYACGTCPDCKWIASGNHPDLFSLIPAADEVEADDEGEGGDTGKKEKARSSQIVIDQVRSLQGSLEVGAGGHAGGRRVVIVSPAEAMNAAAANALLKSLEEPGHGIVYLLISHAPRRLLATIRSRCQVVSFPRPDPIQASGWLKREGVSNPALLGFASGLPLAAREIASGPLQDMRKKVAAELADLQGRDPLRLAADWESRLKAKGAAEAGFTMSTLLSWLQRWLSDGVLVAQGMPARFFADSTPDLQRLASGREGAWLACYRDMHAHRPLAQHPLNQRLFLEEVVLTLYRHLRKV